MDGATCTFCGAPAALVPTEDCRVCAACARRVAGLVASTAAARGEVWDPGAPTAADEEMREVAARVAGELSRDDADAHYYLAVAYRQMGLRTDALESAARAVEAAPNEGKRTAALRLRLTPPLLREGGLALLRSRVARILSN